MARDSESTSGRPRVVNHAQALLATIQMRRSDVQRYLEHNVPRISRWTTLSIVSSAIAAIFTVGPAVAGKSFTATVQSGLSLPDATHVWQPICAVACVASLLATISTQLSKAREASARISSVEAAAGELRGLQVALENGLAVQKAVEQYRRVEETIAFVPSAS